LAKPLFRPTATYVEAMPSPLKPREQGDLGELSAMEWLVSKGARIAIPVFHSPDWDLIAEMGGRALRVQVKTSVCKTDRDRYQVRLSTSGGNQSWNRVIKRFDPSRYDYLFALVEDGRRWFIPVGAIDGSYCVVLGGSKYSEFKIEPGRRLIDDPTLESIEASGEYPRGQRMAAVNRPAQSFAGSTPASPIRTRAKPGFMPSKYERTLGRNGQAIINQKRRVNIPQKPFFEAGFELGDRVRVRSDGYGRVVLERIELPAWARPD